MLKFENIEICFNIKDRNTRLYNKYGAHIEKNLLRLWTKFGSKRLFSGTDTNYIVITNSTKKKTSQAFR